MRIGYRDDCARGGAAVKLTAMLQSGSPLVRARLAGACALAGLILAAPALAAGEPLRPALHAALDPAPDRAMPLPSAAVVEDMPPAPAIASPAPTVTGAIPEIPLPRTIGAEVLVGPMLMGRLAALEGDLALHGGADDVAALRAFYAARNHAPAFVDLDTGTPAWSEAALAMAAILRGADADGLDPAAYPVPGLPAGPALDPGAVADAEIAFATSLVRYAQHARGGRIDPRRLHALITPTLDVPDAAGILSGLVGAEDPAAALAAHQPPHEGYRRLRAALAELRAAEEAPEPLVEIPPGPVLRVGTRDGRVPLLRARFGMDAPAESDERMFDVALAEAVEAFQREHGLAVDGVVGNQTLAALASLDPARREGDLLANMERWRWLPRELGDKHIFVNVAGYRMEVRVDGAPVHESRVIVGKVGQETPIFSDVMEYVVVSPTWTVPPTIMRNEFLPGLREDPNYAAARGFEVIRSGNNISVRQPPGPRNALGHIKFMFPNGHHVYLHDTPNRGLFDRVRRALSYGCVRVEDPFELAHLLLADQGWPKERLRALIGPRERYVHLDTPVPVHLAYFTLEVEESGRILPHEDVYGFDRLVRRALGLES